MENQDVELTTELDQDQFRVDPNEILFGGNLSIEQRLLLAQFTSINKKVDWLIQERLEANKTQNAVNRAVVRHDKILSPIAAVFVAVCGAAGVGAIILQLIAGKK